MNNSTRLCVMPRPAGHGQAPESPQKRPFWTPQPGDVFVRLADGTEMTWLEPSLLPLVRNTEECTKRGAVVAGMLQAYYPGASYLLATHAGYAMSFDLSSHHVPGEKPPYTLPPYSLAFHADRGDAGDACCCSVQ